MAGILLTCKIVPPTATSRSNTKRTTLESLNKSNSSSTKWLISHLMLVALFSKALMMVLHLLIFGQSIKLFMKAGTITTLMKEASHLSISIDSRALLKEHAVSAKSHYMVLSQLIATLRLTNALQRSHLMVKPLSSVQLLSMLLWLQYSLEWVSAMAQFLEARLLSSMELDSLQVLQQLSPLTIEFALWHQPQILQSLARLMISLMSLMSRLSLSTLTALVMLRQRTRFTDTSQGGLMPKLGAMTFLLKKARLWTSPRVFTYSLTSTAHLYFPSSMLRAALFSPQMPIQIMKELLTAITSL